MPDVTKTDKSRMELHHEYLCDGLRITLNDKGLHWYNGTHSSITEYCHMPLSRARALYEILACILKDNPNA